MLQKFTIAGLAAASFTSFTYANAQVMPYPDTIIVLDASNSMWGQIDGVAKILIAREVIGDLVTDLEEDIDFGLVAYGHRDTSNCGDIETVVPVGALDPAGYRQAVNSLTPRGRTPLVAAVEQAATQLDYTTRSARVILVSDGVESCEGDPLALAETLAANGLDTTVHVIGFDVSAIEDQSGLEALAKLNGGLYLTPETSNELKEDLNSMMDMPTAGDSGAEMAADPTAEAAMASAEMPDDAATMAEPAALFSAPASAPQGSPIRVEILAGPSGGASIGIGEAGAEGLLTMAPVSESGSAHLIVPTTKGSYEIRYISADGDVLSSAVLAVE